MLILQPAALAGVRTQFVTDANGQLALLSAAHHEGKLGNLSGVVVLSGGYTLHICIQEMAQETAMLQQ